MNFKALLNKRNYVHFYHQIIPFPNFLKKIPLEYSEYSNLESLIDYLEVREFEKIVVVASGPSAIHLEGNEKHLYICCNNSIKLVQEMNFVYMLQDPFYLMRYLKKFRGRENWKGTIFWFYQSQANKKMFDTIKNYLLTFSRIRREFLITNKENEGIYQQIREILKTDFDYNHFGVNSGFNTLVFAAVIAHKTQIPLELYGLDAGIGGEKYFNKNATLGLNITKDNTRRKISEFLNSLERGGMEFRNHSYFKGETLDNHIHGS